MSAAGNKQVPPCPAAAPEGVGVGTPKGTRRGRKDLLRRMEPFARLLRRDFALEIQDDPKKFKKQAVHALKRCLPPHPGRPQEAYVTRAIELRKQNVPWNEIYRQCIPNYQQLPLAEQRLAGYDLRAACRSRRNASKRRKRHRKSSAETSSAQDVPLVITAAPAPDCDCETTHPRAGPGTQREGRTLH